MWEVLRDGETTGIVVFNLEFEKTYWQGRADVWDTQRLKFHTYQMVPVLPHTALFGKTNYKADKSRETLTFKRS